MYIRHIDRVCIKLGYKNYPDYLHSDNWLVFSKHIKSRRNKCFSCYNKDNLSVHHINYGRLGYELPEDVVVLCKDCHLKCHKMIKEKKSILEKAHIVLQNINNPPLTKSQKKNKKRKEKLKAKKEERRLKYIEKVKEWDRETLKQIPNWMINYV